MPLSNVTTKNQIDIPLRIPQVRVLRALMPMNPSDNPTEWPLLTRPMLGVAAGYTPISGSITRVLNGIHEGSSSGEAHPGLIELGLVESISLEIDGVTETNYCITSKGIHKYLSFVATNSDQLPEVRDASTCTNDRYRIK